MPRLFRKAPDRAAASMAPETAGTHTWRHWKRAKQHLKATARQRALWEDVQQAKLRGLSLRAMARELGVYRNTVRKYALAESPPLRKKKEVTGMQQAHRDAST